MGIPVHQALTLAVPPTVEPVSAAELAGFLRVDDPTDPSIVPLAAAARWYVEKYTGLQLMPSLWRLSLDMFPTIPYLQYSPGLPVSRQPLVNYQWPVSPDLWAIRLPRAPLLAVLSITYTATDGSKQTMDPSTYQVDTHSTLPRITPVAGGYWPTSLYEPDAVQVLFVAGYGEIFTATPSSSTVTIASGNTPSPLAGSSPSACVATNVGGALPAPMVNGSLYTLTSSGPNTFTVTDQTNAAVNFTNGGSGTSCFAAPPETLRHAIKLLAGNWYENRESVVIDKPPDELPMGVKALLGFDRVFNV